MEWLKTLRSRLRALWNAEKIHDEIEEELRFHVDMRTEENIRRGMSPEEARRDAQQRFGPQTRIKEMGYQVRGGGWLEILWQDMHYGLRMLRKNPGFTLVAVVTLALGIGANTAIFSVVNSVLLRPLPYEEPARLVVIWDNFLRLGMEKIGVSAPEFLDYKEQNESFSDIAAFRNVEFALSGEAGAERVAGTRVTANLFPLLGTPPVLGHTFLAEDDQRGADRVVVLSHGLWQRRYGSREDVIGKLISLDGDTYMVIGVMPPGFQFPYRTPQFTERADLWVPAAFSPEELQNRSSYGWSLVARLKPNTTLGRAQSDMDAIVRRLDQQYGYHRGPNGADAGWKATVVPLTEEVVGRIRVVLLVLLGAVAFVLLIACANVANLLLARATARRKEIAVRSALGASRGRIIRQLFTESMLLSLLGGTVGLLLAIYGVELLLSASPNDIPRLEEVTLDGRVLAFTLIASILTGVVFGFAPALRASKLDLNKTLKEGSRSGTSSSTRQHTQSLLAVSEVGMAMVLLIGAGLLIKSFVRLVSVDPGFDPQNVLTLEMALPQSSYPQPSDWTAFYQQILERIETLPGVRSASMVSTIPMDRSAPEAPFSIQGRPYDPAGKPPVVRFQMAGQNYFRTMGIPVVRGRDFSKQDTSETSRVVIINEAMATRFFPGDDPLGKYVKLGAPQAPAPWLVIAGVVKDVRSGGLEREVKPEMYLPFVERPRPSMTFVLRTQSDAASMAAVIRNEVQALDKNQPIHNVRTMGQVVNSSVAQRRFSMFLLAVLAAVALALSAVGLFGVIAYSVGSRTQEIGIRMALGAQHRDVIKMVVGQGLKLALLGVGVGLAVALVLTRFLASMLYEVGATDLTTFASISLLLIAVALLASYIPARRATKIDPNAALRFE